MTRIIGGLNKIQNDINAAIAADINARMGKNKNRVLSRIKVAARSWIENSPELHSLRSTAVPNSLAAVFGLPVGSGSAVAAAIIDAVVQSINLNVGRANKYLKTNIELVFQPSTFSNLLSLPEGYVTTESNNEFHWMDWLLTKGDTVVILGFSYQPQVGRGRSGAGFMDTGGSFRVPPEYSGTLSNNFVTRAFEGKEKQVTAILSELLK